MHLLNIVYQLYSPLFCPHSFLFLPSNSPITARPIKIFSWKGNNYSFVSHTWLLPASTNYSLWFPTVRCLAKHSSKPPHAPAGLATSFSLRQSALMRSILQFMAIWGPVANREMLDNEWIIKGWPVERKDFFDIFATTHATFHLLSRVPQCFFQQWSLDAACKWETLLWV